MAQIKINPEYRTQRVTTAKGVKTIADHSDSELLDLAMQARRSNNPILLRCFNKLPSLEALVNSKVTTELKAVTSSPEPEPELVPVVETELDKPDAE